VSRTLDHGFLLSIGDSIRTPPEAAPAYVATEYVRCEVWSNLQVVVLSAMLLVLATAAAVATVGHTLGLSWPAACMLGAVVAPTDATAVAAVAAVAGHIPRRMALQSVERWT
jgi:monovalent cation/hydrogen antiporter